jgi:ribosomal protein L19
VGSNYFKGSLVFLRDIFSATKGKGELITLRRVRPFIKGFSPRGNKGFAFKSGDILRVKFLRGGRSYFFEGMCLAIKKKSLSHKDCAILLRNLVNTSCIEITAAYYYNRMYNLVFSDFRRKRNAYVRSKLFYMRLYVARHTLV